VWVRPTTSPPSWEQHRLSSRALSFLHRTQAIRINGTAITLLTDRPILQLYDRLDAPSSDIISDP
jgi:hypothetical protein